MSSSGSAGTAFAVEAVDLSKRFDTDPPVDVVRGVDLVVEPGDYVAVTGPSGSGKSSLLNLIGLLDRPTDGRLWIQGVDVTDLGTKARAAIRAQHLGFVFQSFHLLYDRTTVDNVELAFRYRPETNVDQRAAAREALERVGLGHRLDAFPATLSGGERQRVAVARAIVGRPDVLLADEPTGNLDAATTAEILDLFDELNRGELTIVVITHDPEVSSRAARVIQLRDGEIAHDERTRPAVSSNAQPGHTQPAPGQADGDTVVPPWGPRPSRGLVLTVADLLTSTLARPGRTALTALGTVLGIASLLATVGAADTAGNQIVSRFDALSATQVIVEPVAVVGEPDSETSTMGWDIETRLDPLNGVVASGGYRPIAEPGFTRTIPRIGSADIDERDIDVVAATPGTFAAVGIEAARGRLFNTIHQQRGDAVAVLGPAAADRLGVHRPESSPSIFVGGTQLVVIGVLDADTVTRAPNLAAAIIVPDTWASTRYPTPGPDTVAIRTDPGAAALIASQAPVALSPNDPSALHARRAAEPVRMRDEVRQDLNSLLIVLGLIAIVVGGLGIANVTLVSVLERTGEIGLRGAIGGRPATIATQFLAESALLGLISGIVGASLGIIVLAAISRARDWTMILDPRLPIAAPILGATIGIAAGAYPAWRAARIDPATALRSGT